MRTLLLGALATVTVMLGCAGGTDDSVGASTPPVPGANTPAASQVQTDTPIPTPTATPAGRWDASAVYEPDYERIGSVCGVAPITLSPSTDDADRSCILQAMQESNASQQAMEFFQEENQFLTVFEETGRIDSGAESAPWFNMSRPMPLFLNTEPGVLDVSQVIPTVWEQDERYAAIVRQAVDLRGERVFVWAEYATITSLGNEEFSVSYPLRSCRACETHARLQVRLTFDSHGVLIDQSLLPPIHG